MTAAARSAFVVDPEEARHLPSRHRLIRTQGDETLEDALHRRLGGAALRGAVAGAGSLGLLTVLVAFGSGISIAASGGLGAAVGLTGGPFFGSLAGFAIALGRAERMRSELGDGLVRRDAVLVMPVARRLPRT